MFGDPVTFNDHEDSVILKDVCDFYSGTGFPKQYQGNSKGLYPFYKVGDISNNILEGNIVLSQCDNYVDEKIISILKGTVIPEDTVVFAKIGEAIKLNRRAITPKECLVDNNVMGIKPHSNCLNIQFFYEFMRTVDLYALASATTVPSLRKTVLENIKIRIPKLETQNLFADFVKQVNASKVICKQIFHSFDALVKSRFIEMFGTMDQPKVPFKQLGDVATYVNGYAFKPTDWGTEGLPIIRIQNLSGSGDSFNYYAGEYPQDIEINKGDIMISWSATLGVFVWNGPKALLNQHIFKVYFDKIDVNPTYFRIAVEPALKLSASKVHGSTMTHLTKKTFNTIKIAMPSIDQQDEFASFVEQVDKSKFV